MNSTIIKKSCELVQVIREVIEVVPKTPIEIIKWIKYCNAIIRLVNKAKKTCENIAEKRSLQNYLALLKGYRAKISALSTHHGAGVQNVVKNRFKWEDIESAFKSRLRTGVIINMDHVDPEIFLEDVKKTFCRRVKNAVIKHLNLKVNAVLCCEFVISKNDEILQDLKYFNTINKTIDCTTNMKKWYDDNIKQPILTQLEEFQESGSGWALKSIINLIVNINKYEQFRGSSYIDLPKEIKAKQACINVQNDDEACFAWAVVSALYAAGSSSSYRMSSYPHYSTVLNLNGVKFPMTLKQIDKFEKLNDLSVNVFALKKKRGFSTFPVRVTKNKRDSHINLLMVQDHYDEEKEEEEEASLMDVDEDDVEVKYHFCWIKNLSRLVSTQLTRTKNFKHICDRCLNYFNTAEKLKNHEVDCSKINKCKVRMPREDEKIISFKDFNSKEWVPFIIYADIESILKPIADASNLNTQRYQEHEVHSIGYYFKSYHDDSLSYYSASRDKDCQRWFALELQKITEQAEMWFSDIRPINMSTRDEMNFRNAVCCHICEKPFGPDDERVRDHCHFTGRFRGAAHNACNINYNESRVIPVVFHNLSGYDAHFIIQEISTAIPGNVSLLPINKERYISFTKYIDGSGIKFRFIDSFRFMAESLDKLASYLPKEKMIITKKEWSQLNDVDYNLLTRKGVFPYDFIDSWDKLDYKQLPAKEDFTSKLNGYEITDADYTHAETIWQNFNIENLGQYSDIYLKTDVLLLADIFENFRQNCMKTYMLDVANYYTSPGYTWSAMMKYTKVQLELLTDVDMLLFIERGIRGGVSQCSNRYSKANNKYMDSYNPEEPSKYLMYYDVNNLYGWAMSQYLPTSGFKWVNGSIDVKTVPDDSAIGYILEVDIEYPQHLHDEHKDFPLNPIQQAPPGAKLKKLLTTLENKEKYIIYYRNLKQSIEQGLKIKKVHRILQFNQQPWLKKYIDLNTEMRKKATNDFEKNLFKLMNNAVFGKTMENVRNHSDIKLKSNWFGRYGAKVLIAKPNFHSRTIFNENLVAIEMLKTEIFFNKPIYVGMVILDLAKTCVYDFHYNYMQYKYKDNCKIMYTDTDSLIYEIKCDDIYDTMKQDIHKYDTSDYPSDNIYKIPQANKKIPGLMKDELNGKIMTEFVGLRAKMYSYLVNGTEYKKAKGIKNYVLKNSVTFENYKACLLNSMEIYRTQNSFRSNKHNVYTIKQNKIALSPHDNKRSMIAGTTDTLPYGHYSILTDDGL